MKPVLFTSQRPLERAENLRTVYDAYQDPKMFLQLDANRRHNYISPRNFSLMVTDEYPAMSPGKVIMIWHAIEGGKTVGFDQPGPYICQRDIDVITRATASGTGVIKRVWKTTGLPPERIVPTGLPRTDIYVGKRKGDGGTFLAGKRTYLYVPTFRTKRETNMPDLDWQWLDNELTDDELFAVKPHPITGHMITQDYRHIVEIPATEPSTNYLMDCDVVVSDYSSIIFDGYLLNKPSVLIEKVYGYTESRGMYMRYPVDYSSRFCTDEATMLKLCREADGLTATEQDVIDKVADMCDGHATERVIKLIEDISR